MAQFLRGFIFWPLTFLAVMLAIANRGPVRFSFDPFNQDAPAFAIMVPVFIILMVGVLLGILLGGMSAWADQAHWRRKARQYRQRLKALEAQQTPKLNAVADSATGSTALATVR